MLSLALFSHIIVEAAHLPPNNETRLEHRSDGIVRRVVRRRSSGHEDETSVGTTVDGLLAHDSVVRRSRRSLEHRATSSITAAGRIIDSHVEQVDSSQQRAGGELQKLAQEAARLERAAAQGCNGETGAMKEIIVLDVLPTIVKGVERAQQKLFDLAQVISSSWTAKNVDEPSFSVNLTDHMQCRSQEADLLKAADQCKLEEERARHQSSHFACLGNLPTASLLEQHVTFLERAKALCQQSKDDSERGEHLESFARLTHMASATLTDHRQHQGMDGWSRDPCQESKMEHQRIIADCKNRSALAEDKSRQCAAIQTGLDQQLCRAHTHEKEELAKCDGELSSLVRQVTLTQRLEADSKALWAKVQKILCVVRTCGATMAVNCSDYEWYNDSTTHLDINYPSTRACRNVTITQHPCGDEYRDKLRATSYGMALSPCHSCWLPDQPTSDTQCTQDEANNHLRALDACAIRNALVELSSSSSAWAAAFTSPIPECPSPMPDVPTVSPTEAVVLPSVGNASALSVKFAVKCLDYTLLMSSADMYIDFTLRLSIIVSTEAGVELSDVRSDVSIGADGVGLEVVAEITRPEDVDAEAIYSKLARSKLSDTLSQRIIGSIMRVSGIEKIFSCPAEQLAIADPVIEAHTNTTAVAEPSSVPTSVLPPKEASQPTLPTMPPLASAPIPQTAARTEPYVSLPVPIVPTGAPTTLAETPTAASTTPTATPTVAPGVDVDFLINGLDYASLISNSDVHSALIETLKGVLAIVANVSHDEVSISLNAGSVTVLAQITPVLSGSLGERMLGRKNLSEILSSIQNSNELRGLLIDATLRVQGISQFSTGQIGLGDIILKKTTDSTTYLTFLVGGIRFDSLVADPDLHDNLRTTLHDKFIQLVGIPGVQAQLRFQVGAAERFEVHTEIIPPPHVTADEVYAKLISITNLDVLLVGAVQSVPGIEVVRNGGPVTVEVLYVKVVSPSTGGFHDDVIHPVTGATTQSPTPSPTRSPTSSLPIAMPADYKYLGCAPSPTPPVSVRYTMEMNYAKLLEKTDVFMETAMKMAIAISEISGVPVRDVIVQIANEGPPLMDSADSQTKVNAVIVLPCGETPAAVISRFDSPGTAEHLERRIAEVHDVSSPPLGETSLALQPSIPPPLPAQETVFQQSIPPPPPLPMRFKIQSTAGQPTGQPTSQPTEKVIVHVTNIEVSTHMPPAPPHPTAPPAPPLPTELLGQAPPLPMQLLPPAPPLPPAEPLRTKPLPSTSGRLFRSRPLPQHRPGYRVIRELDEGSALLELGTGDIVSEVEYDGAPMVKVAYMKCLEDMGMQRTKLSSLRTMFTQEEIHLETCRRFCTLGVTSHNVAARLQARNNWQ